MSLQSLANKYTATTTKQGSLSGLAGLAAKYSPATTTKKTSSDLDTLEGLRSKAEEVGLGEEASKIADETPRLSFLQRLGAGLDILNPAEAILTGTEKGLGAGIAEYGKDIFKGAASAITGKDYIGEKRHFSEVVEKLGIENGIAKAGLGFLGDVFLDPSTYFGGAIVKGLLKGAKIGGGVALKGISKFAPEAATGLEMIGTGVKDALGRAFQYGYKATKGAKEDLLGFLSKTQKAKLGLAASNLDRLGTGVLTQSQREELALKMIAGKRAEFQLGEETSKSAIETVNKLFPEMKVKNASHAEKILQDLETTTQKNVQDIRTEVDKIVKPFFDTRQKLIKGGKILESKTGLQTTPALGSFQKVDQLNGIVNGLKQQLSKLRAGRVPIAKLGEETVTDLGGAITKEEAIQAHNSLIKYEEERLAETIENLSSKIENTKLKPATTGAKVPPLGSVSPEETIIYAERMIKKLQNDLADKSRLLTTATTGRITGSALIKAARETGDFSKIEEIAPQLVKDIKSGSNDPVVQKALDEQIARTKTFASKIGVENPYEIYFPFIRSDKVQKFLSETSGLKVGSEGYKKQFKNLLSNENIELDPAKAFFTRESQQVTDKMTRDFLSGFVGKYGKGLEAFKNSDDAAREGYQLIREKGIFGKELGYVPEFDAKLIRDSISPEFQTINMLAKATGFDALTSLFKRSVTGLFAPFHVRNFVSGNIQNFEKLGAEVFNPKYIATGQKIAYLMGKGKKIPGGTIDLGGKTMKFSQVMKPFVDRFSGDTFYNADFDAALKAGSELKSVSKVFSKARVKETAKTLGLGQEAIPFKIGRAIGQYIEHQQKATAYITALAQGKTMKEALSLAEGAGFDYRALTRFESQIMRRLIPFYSFTRKNLQLQLETLGENPQRINQIFKFFEGVSDQDTLTDEERKMLPDYLRDQIAIGFGKNKLGQPLIAGGFGTPVEQPGQLIGKTGSETIRKIASTLNPLIKTPLEKAFGKDFFQNRPINENVDAKQYQILPDYIKDFIGFREVPKDILEKNAQGKLVKTGEKITYTADPEKLHILRNLPTSRLFSYLYEIYRPEEETIQGAKALNLFSGIKPKPIDLQTVAYFRDKEKRAELEQLLMRVGVLKEFRNVYVPKK